MDKKEYSYDIIELKVITIIQKVKRVNVITNPNKLEYEVSS